MKQKIEMSKPSWASHMTDEQWQEVWSKALKDAEKMLKEEETPNAIYEDYLTCQQVADLLNVSKASVWRYVRLGYIKPCKLGKRTVYPRSCIDNAIKSVSHDER
jgi:predicted DNA-binding transcriptional regulator AlpA